jgi:hypothetical protein
MKTMKHPHHSLLPIHLQNALMSAASSERMEFIDQAIRDVYQAMPQKFHNEKTIAERKFYNEPRRIVPNAGFVIPLSAGVDR